jgi:lipopolysaccharide transport system permease protein
VFSEVAIRSPGLVLSVPNYVKKVVFPLEVLPVVALLSAVVHSLIGVAILLVGSWVLRGSISPLVVFLPAAYLPLFLLCLAVGWFLASLGVYVRDIGQGTPVIVQFLMFLSPVVYPVTAVPEGLRPILQLNPMTSIIELFRTLLLWAEAPSWRTGCLWTLLSGGAAWLGYAWFMRSRKGFADVL